MIDPLTAIHQAAEYQQHLARLIELVLAPSLNTLRAQSVQRQIQQQQLREFRDSLAIRTPAWTQMPPLPPRPPQPQVGGLLSASSAALNYTELSTLCR